MPPEDTDNALPSTPIQPQQVPAPQFPPVNIPQNATPEPSQAKTFPTKKLIIGIAILLVVVLISAVGGYYFINQKQKGSQDKIALTETVDEEIPNTSISNNVFVLLDTYKNPDEKYQIYKINVDDGKEEEIWSKQFKNDYQFGGISFPDLSHNKKNLFYFANEEFYLIETESGKLTTIKNSKPNLFPSYRCAWNNKDTQVFCPLNEGGSKTEAEKEQVILLIDVTNGTQTILTDINDKNLFKEFGYYNPLGWDKNDETLIFSREISPVTKIYTLNKITKAVGLKELQGRFNRLRYSPAVEKVIYINEDKKSINAFDPISGQDEQVYSFPDKFVSDISIVQGKYLVFQEDNYYITLFGSDTSTPKDGKLNSFIKIMDLTNRKTESIEYPFNLEQKDRFTNLNINDYNPANSTLVFTRSDLISNPISQNLEDATGETTVYSLNLDSKKLTKMFTRSKKDFANDIEFQFGVIPQH